MAVSFNLIPQGILTPGIYTEFDTSRAQQGPSIQPYKVLMLGQSLATGTKGTNTLSQVTSTSQAKSFYGRGSMLAAMCEAFFNENKINPLWVWNVADAAGAVKAKGTITVGVGGDPAVATTETPLIYIIDGVRISVPVEPGDTANGIATAIAAAINADPEVEVTAAATTNVVTLTARHGGEVANGYHLSRDESAPLPGGVTSSTAGIGTGVRGATAGTKNPVTTDGIAAIGEETFNIICSPYLDVGNMGKWDKEMIDRWGPLRQNDGQIVSARRGTVTAQTTYMGTLNSEQITVIDCLGPSGPHKWSANLAGVLARELQADPGRPMQSVPLRAILSPDDSEQRTQREANLLLAAGMSTTTVNGGITSLQRIRTTRKTDALGEADTALADLNSKAALSYIRFDFRRRFIQKFSRHKISDDGVKFGPGQSVITPLLAKSEILALFEDWQELGLVEGIAQFENDLLVERSATDPNRLDIRMPPDLINQLRVTAAQIQFLL